MKNKTKITTAPPNLWWVEHYAKEGYCWAFPIIAIEHYYDDDIRRSNAHGTESSEIIFLMSDGSGCKERFNKGALGMAIHAHDRISAIAEYKSLNEK